MKYFKPSSMGKLFYIFLLMNAGLTLAAGGSHKVNRDYVVAPPAPASQTQMQMDAKSAGCQSCHTKTDKTTMHANPAVKLGCTDCHGGDANVRLAAGDNDKNSVLYQKAMAAAHVLPQYPDDWHYIHLT
jgi:hypothetical protein